MKFITIADLKAKNACSEGIRLYKENGYETLDWDSIDELDIDVKYNIYIRWLCTNFKISLRFNGYEFIFDKNNNGYTLYYDNSRGYWEEHKYDKNNNELYFEDSNGYWVKQEFDENNNKIYFENSHGFWATWEFDENNNQIYFEKSEGYWATWEYDKNNNEIYYENSDGVIIDNREGKNEIHNNS